jgi:hypothetical protein
MQQNLTVAVRFFQRSTREACWLANKGGTGKRKAGGESGIDEEADEAEEADDAAEEDEEDSKMPPKKGVIGKKPAGASLQSQKLVLLLWTILQNVCSSSCLWQISFGARRTIASRTPLLFGCIHSHGRCMLRLLLKC